MPGASFAGSLCANVQFFKNVKIKLSLQRELNFGWFRTSFSPFWTVQEGIGGILEPLQSLRRRSGAALKAGIAISEGLEALWTALEAFWGRWPPSPPTGR